MLITDSQAAAEFCHQVRGAEFLAVDTEFIRERTYRANLCLVQIADGKRAAVIDALAPDMDLAPVLELMADRQTLKVFHSASQDVEIFYSMTRSVPAPVFDTQIAAMVCGFGEQPAYATLVAEITGRQLDKSSQMTDWARRPLTDRQIDYALRDVVHLVTIYEELRHRLKRTGRTSWVEEEMRALEDEANYAPNPDEQYRKIRLRRPSRRALAVLREVAAWRERTAMRRNIPRGHVVRDEALVEITMNTPTRPDDLERVRGVSARFAHGRDGSAVLAAVQRGLELPEEQCPQVPRRRSRMDRQDTLVALLQALLKLRCEAHGVAPQMVASRVDLDRLATESNPDVRALTGWRRELFGEDALALKDGRLALTGDGAGVTVVGPR